MSDTQRARENYAHFCYARDHGHLDFVAKAERCDRYFAGAQWDPRVVARLERLGKPVLTVNKILSTCATLFGEQLNNRADVSFRPARGGNPETAHALDQVWLHIVNTQNLDWLESEVAADGFIRSRGFFDARIRFDDQLRGEVAITQLNAKNVVIDPDAEAYDPDEWKEVFLTKWLTLDDVERIYGQGPATELRARPHTAYVYAYDSLDWLPDTFGGRDRLWGAAPSEDEHRRRIVRVIERQYRERRTVDWFVDLTTGDARPVPTTWDAPRIAWVSQQFGLGIVKRPTEIIHWRVSADDLLLHDAVSPYRHFTPVPYFPYFRHGQTLGVVEHLISPQDLLNKALSQELHIINTTANSGWILKAGALVNMTIEELQERGGEDGLVIEAATSPRDIEKIQANAIPTGLDRLSFKADESLKEVSMISDSMRGFDRADVAAKAIQAKQLRGSVSLAKPFDNLAHTRRLLARNVLDLVQSFYDEERTLMITGRNLTDPARPLVLNQVTPEGAVVNDLTAGEYAAVVTTVPARQDYEQSQFQEALEMRQLGIAIPDDVLVEHSHLGRKSEIAERIKQLNGGGEPSQAQQQLAQLELQLKQLEAAEKQANVQVKQSNAALNEARAQKERREPQEAADATLALERERLQAEIQLKREELQAQLQLQWLKLKAEIALKRQELALKQALQQQQVASAEAHQQQQDAAQARQVDAEIARADQAQAAEQDQAERRLDLEQSTTEQRLALEKQRAVAPPSRTRKETR